MGFLPTTDANDDEHQQCGIGGAYELQVNCDGPSILLKLADGEPVELHKRKWIYGFKDCDDLVPLQLRFVCTRSELTLQGWLKVVGSSAEPTRLVSDGTALLLTLGKPEEEDDEPELALTFNTASPTGRFGIIKDIDSPESAQPELVIQVKKRCPTTGLSGPKTADD
jgi:hypothetical protein